MTNRSQAKGTAFESSLVPLLQQYYPHKETGRRGKQGARDKGDFRLIGEDRFAIEAKNVVKVDLAGWMNEAEAEAGNLGVPYGVVVHKRKGKTDPSEQWVTCTLGTFMALVNLPLGD